MPKAVNTRYSVTATGVRQGKVKRATPKRTFTKLSPEEVRLARGWYSKDIEPSEIATRLPRDKSTMTRLLVKQKPRLEQGRKPVLTKAEIDFHEERLRELIARPFVAYHEMTSENESLYKPMHLRSAFRSNTQGEV